MNETKFVVKEKISKRSSLLRDVVGYLRRLPLLWRAMPFCLVLILTACAIPSYFRWYLGKLSDCNSPQGCNALDVFDFSIEFTLKGLVTIAALGVLLRVLSWFIFEGFGQWSTQNIFQKMLAGLARVRTTYFDEHPSGRILNRLIGDYNAARLISIIRIGDFLNALAEVVAVGVLVSFVNIIPALLILPVLILFFRIQRRTLKEFHRTRNELSIAMGGVLHKQSDLIEGRSTYQSYQREISILSKLKSAYTVYLDAYLKANFLRAANSLHIHILSECYAAFVLIFLILALRQNAIDLTLASVIMSSIFSLSTSFVWLTYNTGALADSMAQVLRLFEYIDLPSEEAEERDSSLRPFASPASCECLGDIIFEKFTMSYRQGGSTILNDLSLTIKHGIKTAVIGRTGSGKSSLIQAIFRMVYVQEGDIKIGSTSVYDQDIYFLRSQFAMVPQNPYLFAGTVRDNLDRSLSLSTAVLEYALNAVGIDVTLDTGVEEGGQNFSQGERQLLCLARAIAANKNFVFMDEPTSAIDVDTDKKIQKILHTSFSGKTVVTIAHRLETIQDYDWIIEMKDGEVLKQGTPQQFMSGLVADTQIHSNIP